MLRADGKISAFQRDIDAYDADFHPGSRAWLDSVLEGWISSEQEDFNLLIVGEPGVGKSAYIAHLARRYGFPRYFARSHTEMEIAVTAADPRAFLVSIGEQLGQLYGSQIFRGGMTISGTVSVEFARGTARATGTEIEEAHYSHFRPMAVQGSVKGGTLSDHTQLTGVRIKRLVDTAWAMAPETLLQEALVKPLAEIATLYPGETVVLLVDGLDVSSQQTRPRIVDLIPTISNLRVIMTSRPGPHLARFSASKQIYLTDTGHSAGDSVTNNATENTEDIRKYTQAVIETDPTIAPFMAQRGIGQTYIDAVVSASESNFLYLRHFFDTLRQEITAGRAGISVPLAAPRGLRGIYRTILIERIKADNTDALWEEVYTPVLGVLAVAQEPLTRHQLAAYSGVPVEGVASVLLRLREFLNFSEPNRFSIFHASFGEFLLDEVQNPDCALDGPTSHTRIASYFLGPQLSCEDLDRARLSEHGAYGVRNMLRHLRAANLQDALKELLEADSGHLWASIRHATEGTCTGYLCDLDVGLEAATANGAADITSFVMLALLKSSVSAITTNISPDLALLLLKSGFWNPQQVFDHIRLNRSPLERLRGLVKLLKTGKVDQPFAVIRDLWSEVFRTLSQVPHPHRKALEFRSLCADIPVERLPDAANALSGIDSPTWQSLCLSLLARRAEEPLRSEVLDRALQKSSEVTDHYWRALTLAAAAGQMGDAGGVHLAKAFDAAMEEADEHFQAKLLGYMAEYLPSSHLEKTWKYVRDLPAWQLDTSGKWRVREEALHGYAPALARKGLVPLAVEAVALLEERGWLEQSMVAMAETIRACPPEESVALTTQFIEGLDKDLCDDLLAILKVAEPYLTGALLADVIQKACGSSPDAWAPEKGFSTNQVLLYDAATVLSGHIPKDKVAELRAFILEKGQSVSGAADLRKLATFLVAAGDHAEAESLVDRAESDFDKVQVLLAVAEGRDEEGRDDVLRRCIQLAENIAERPQRVTLLTLIAPLASDKMSHQLESAAIRLAGAIEDAQMRIECLAALASQIKVSTKRSAFMRRCDGVSKAAVSAWREREQEMHARYPSQPPGLISEAGSSVERVKALRAELERTVAMKEVVYQRDTPSERQEALEILFEGFLGEGCFEDAVRTAKAMRFAYSTGRHSYFRRLLRAGAYAVAINHFHGLGAPVSELVAEIPRLPYEVLDLALNKIGEIDVDEDRGRALEAFSQRHLEAPLLEETLPFVTGVDSRQRRQSALIGIAKSLQSLASAKPEVAYDIFSKALRRLATRSRPDLLSDVAACSSMLAEFGGVASIESLGKAVTAVCRKWP